MMGGGGGQPQMLVLHKNTKREHGRRAQLANVAAAKAVSEVVRTCLGPRSMLKMLLDPMGGIVLTNDGSAVLREVDASHPAAKSIIELSRTQDDEVGDGTTSVVILAGEMLQAAEPFLERETHPTVIIRAYFQALKDAIEHLDKHLARPIDLEDRERLLQVVDGCLGTKFVHRWGRVLNMLALDAVQLVMTDGPGGRDIDIKRNVRVEKIPGGEIEDSTVIRGVMLNKDVLHSKMRRRIERPRVVVMDCGLEYKKLENAMTIEATKAEDLTRVLQEEEDYIKAMCDQILAVKPDLVIVEKGISDLAQHYLVKNNVTALRRLRKTDSQRVARAVGARLVHQPEDLKEADVGTKCGLYEVRLIGDEYWSFIEKCEDPKACSILLRGASRDVLNEVARNLDDAVAAARNVLLDPRVVPGGGACEMAVSQALLAKSRAIEGEEQLSYRAVAEAFEVIPRTLMQNCGAQVVRLMTQLRAKHAAEGGAMWGIDGNKGQLVDMTELDLWEPYSVKAQTYKTAIESACILLRVDDVLSGIAKGGQGGPPPGAPGMGGMGGPPGMGGMDQFE